MAAHIKIYRQGAWHAVTKLKIYRQGAWHTVTKVKVYRQGAWHDVYIAGPPAPTSLSLTDLSVCLGPSVYRVQLAFSGGGPQYKIYRNSSLIATVSSSPYTDNIGTGAGEYAGTYFYDVYSWDGSQQSGSPISSGIFVPDPCNP